MSQKNTALAMMIQHGILLHIKADGAVWFISQNNFYHLFTKYKAKVLQIVIKANFITLQIDQNFFCSKGIYLEIQGY